MTSRGVKPLFLTRWTLQPHRDPGPRVQCTDCRGGGSVNDVPCARCGSRGWTDARNPPRTAASDEITVY